MKKRFLAVTLGLSLLLTLGVVGVSAKKVTVTYWHGWVVDHEKAAMDEVIRMFNETHPDIEVIGVAGTTNEKLLTAMAGGNPPDAASIWSTQTLAEGASRGSLVQLDPLLERDNIDRDVFVPAALATATYDGRLYGLPIVVDPFVLYYNKDLFREAGLDPNQPPLTLSELLAYDEKITRQDAAGAISTLGFNNGASTDFLYYVFGGGFYDAEAGKPIGDNPANVRALTWLVDLYNRYGTTNVMAFQNSKWANALSNPMISGAVGMQLDGDWVCLFMEKFAPDTDWGTAYFPYEDGYPERAKMSAVDGAINIIPKGAKNAEAAWEFISWFQTTPEATSLFARGIANGPPLRSVAADPDFSMVPQYKTVTDILLEGILYPWPALPYSALYYDELSKAQELALYGQKSPEKALQDMQARIEREHAKHNR